MVQSCVWSRCLQLWLIRLANTSTDRFVDCPLFCLVYPWFLVSNLLSILWGHSLPLFHMQQLNGLINLNILQIVRVWTGDLWCRRFKCLNAGPLEISFLIVLIVIIMQHGVRYKDSFNHLFICYKKRARDVAKLLKSFLSWSSVRPS